MTNWVKVKCPCGEIHALYKNMFLADNAVHCHKCKGYVSQHGGCKILKEYKSKKTMIVTGLK